MILGNLVFQFCIQNRLFGIMGSLGGGRRSRLEEARPLYAMFPRNAAPMSPYHEIHVLVVLTPGLPDSLAPIRIVSTAHDEDCNSVQLII